MFLYSVHVPFSSASSSADHIRNQFLQVHYIRFIIINDHRIIAFQDIYMPHTPKKKPYLLSDPSQNLTTTLNFSLGKNDLPSHVGERSSLTKILWVVHVTTSTRNAVTLNHIHCQILVVPFACFLIQFACSYTH
ncbi:hypothetical protein M378DRAFT_859543 [Amanita muscaria Koide BX008]|uniref:Uncharacterized protein n=1 Tax=Amanita muscaria (strain Koide BX008) TaxID=946122 RepID=A0A0C2WIC5_AMAMK|nr:hypothetical protein M378DRAFT_859543 [Amanita muscaria Koide BX008]